LCWYIISFARLSDIKEIKDSAQVEFENETKALAFVVKKYADYVATKIEAAAQTLKETNLQNTHIGVTPKTCGIVLNYLELYKAQITECMEIETFAITLEGIITALHLAQNIQPIRNTIYPLNILLASINAK
jgi:hypothetical protein